MPIDTQIFVLICHDVHITGYINIGETDATHNSPIITCLLIFLSHQSFSIVLTFSFTISCYSFVSCFYCSLLIVLALIFYTYFLIVKHNT